MNKILITWVCFVFLVGLSGGVSAQTSPPQGLVSCWNFDEGTGTVAYDFIGGNHGTLVNGPVWTTGQVNGALSFDGVDDVVRVPDVGQDLDGFSQLTIEAWIGSDDDVPGGAIVSKYDSRLATGVSYYVDTGNGRLRMAVFQSVNPPSGAWITSEDIVISQGVWTHIAGVWKGGTEFELYVNGVKVQGTVFIEGSTPTAMANNDVPVNIGRFESFSGTYVGPYGWFDGLIDGVAIWNRALTAEEIQQHYENGLAGFGYCEVSVKATIGIRPDTLNLKSHKMMRHGRWITAYIELPEGYDVADINVSTVLLNDTISAKLRPSSIGDHDNDGIPDLMVKFDRSDMINMIKALNLDLPTDVELTVTGSLTDGTQFEGSDTIRIIEKGRHKHRNKK